MVSKYLCFTLYSATRYLLGFFIFICFLVISLTYLSCFNKPCFCFLFFHCLWCVLLVFLCFFLVPIGFLRCNSNPQFRICLPGFNFDDFCSFWLGIGRPFNHFLSKELLLCVVWLIWCLWPALNLLAWSDMTRLILALCDHRRCCRELSFCSFFLNIVVGRLFSGGKQS